jgi:hypothetical protein
VVAAILDFQSIQKKKKYVEDHPMISHIQFGFNEISGFGKKLFVHFLYGPMLKLCLVVGEHLEILINIKKTFKRPYKEHS